jgi:hypothetical protein
MTDSLRAAVLAGAISLDPQPVDPFALRVTAIRRVIHHEGNGLELDAAYFRYSIDRHGDVHPLPALPGARISRDKAHHRRNYWRKTNAER